MLVYTSAITSGKNWFGTVQWDFSVMNKQKNRLLRSPFKVGEKNLVDKIIRHEEATDV
jgi:hypothetical protein